MGFSPAEIDRMSPWEYKACVDGYQRAQGHGEKKQPVDVDDDVLKRMGIEGF